VALLTDGFAFDDGTRNEGLWDVPFSRVTGPGPLNPDDWMVAYAKDGSIVTRFGMPVIDYPDGIPLRLTNPLVDKPVYGSMLGLCSTIGLGALGIGFALHDLFCKPKVAKGR
jgi:hypothetical protein